MRSGAGVSCCAREANARPFSASAWTSRYETRGLEHESPRTAHAYYFSVNWRLGRLMNTSSVYLGRWWPRLRGHTYKR